MSTMLNGGAPTKGLHIQSLEIAGFRALGHCTATLGNLEVIAGANGSGKTSLFEFLRLLRDAMIRGRISSEVLDGAIGLQVFHRPGKDVIDWHIKLTSEEGHGFMYQGTITGPMGAAKVVADALHRVRDPSSSAGLEALLDPSQSTLGQYDLVTQGADGSPIRQTFLRQNLSHLALAASHPAQFKEVLDVQATIRSWAFYSGLNVNLKELREPGVVEEEPKLREDLSNLGAVLHYLSLEHRDLFEELQLHLRGVVPGFRAMTVRGRGRGRVEVLWQENGWSTPDISLADLSDGTIRLIAWITLALIPNPPPLICIDEPEEGVHPRTLPKLAGLFSKLAEKTQVLLATHSSYFLLQFPLEHLAVMRKEQGGGVFRKPRDSPALVESLDDFGVEEIEHMHRSGELEHLP